MSYIIVKYFLEWTGTLLIEGDKTVKISNPHLDCDRCCIAIHHIHCVN
jgi:hypothetical protein